MPKITFIVFLIAISCYLVASWTDIGHVLTAEIARRQLPPATVDKLNAISNTFNPYFKGRSITQLPYSATFMDKIKRDTQLFDSLHFINLPLQTGGDYQAPNPDSMNALTALQEASKTLIYQDDTGVWSKGFALLLMTHLLGDLHQPLHAVTLFNEHFVPPTGDLGGNRWNIHFQYLHKRFTQLHLLFDCVGGIWCEYLPDPVTSAFAQNISLYADEIQRDFPIDSFSETELYPDISSSTNFYDVLNGWAFESYNLAAEAYQSYPLNDTITEETILWARTILRKRIAMAGYRMAHVFSKINTDIHNAPEDFSQQSRLWIILTITSCIATAIACIILISSCCRRAAEQPSQNQSSGREALLQNSINNNDEMYLNHQVIV